MKISEFKSNLDELTALNFIQPNGMPIPSHFHITEAGLTTKHFIDCGGTVRTEKSINFQVWVAQDVDHRLKPDKLKGIILKAEKLFGGEDLDIEVEYQNETIGRYAVELDGQNFMLIPKETDCLAKENCGVPVEKTKLQLSELSPAGCCTPGGGCC